MAIRSSQSISAATARATRAYPMQALADDLAWLSRELGLAGPVVVGGHSMGGVAAFDLAARHPDIAAVNAMIARFLAILPSLGGGNETE